MADPKLLGPARERFDVVLCNQVARDERERFRSRSRRPGSRSPHRRRACCACALCALCAQLRLQVFEHVPQPFAAVKALFNLLKPGGLALWTALFMERFHRNP